MRLPEAIENEIQAIEAELASRGGQQAGSPRLRGLRGAIEAHLRGSLHPDPSKGCQCVCHSYPDHTKLQDALEALKWHQEKLTIALADPWRKYVRHEADCALGPKLWIQYEGFTHCNHCGKTADEHLGTMKLCSCACGAAQWMASPEKKDA